MSADLEQRMAKLEETMLRMVSLLELTTPRTSPAIQKQWLAKKMEEKHHLTWSELRNDSEFVAMFPKPDTFYCHANQMAKIRGWNIGKVGNLLYYYDDSFDIEKVRKTAKWRKYQANNPRLSEFLVEEVILPAGEPVNILDYLRVVYSEQLDDWYFEVIDSLEAYIKRKGYLIDQNGDVFWKRGVSR